MLDQVVHSQHPLPELHYYSWTLESSLYQKQLSSARGGSLRGASQAVPPFLEEFYLGFTIVLKINILKGNLPFARAMAAAVTSHLLPPPRQILQL